MEAIRQVMRLASRWIGGRRARATVSASIADGGAPRRPGPVRVIAANDARTTRQRDGDEGEAFARRYLERAGLAFVAANVRYRDGELDLVMRDARGRAAPVLVFVEVRRRASASHGGAAASITADKRRRLVAAASHFVVGLGLRTLPPCRFDVVTIDGARPREFTVEWIRDAFGESA